MNLSRREAMTVLVGMVGLGAVIGTGRRLEEGDLDETTIATHLHAAAEAVYPSQIEFDREFIERHSRERTATREGYGTQQADALRILDNRSRTFAGRSFVDLSPTRRRTVLRDMGVDRAAPVPDGTEAERVRFYVVNDLLYALFTTPTGTRPLGLENPPGYPGGRQPYQRSFPV